MTDYLEVAKSITREHVYNLETESALRKVIMETLRESAKGNWKIWTSGDTLTERILEKFTVEVKRV